MLLNDDSVSNVVTGTSLAVIFGATTGSSLAVLRNASVKQYATSTAVNCGLFSVTFFSIREAFLAFQRSKNPQFGLKDSQTQDADALFSSAMAGATTGGLLAAVARGPRGLIPGFFMFGAFCTTGQLLYTAGYRWRQNIILRSQENDQKSIESPIQVSTSLQRNINIPAHSTVYDDDENFKRDTAQDREWRKNEDKKSLWDWFEVPKWSPIRKLTDEEYKAILDAKLRELEAEMEDIDREMGTTSK
ncbi:hypothetical protein K450DRAFT_278848 [Umbelopsis ramanniana AG]|uniref:Uncharacterized protein n=1 Tax=Umbelopsis ramanniana AG TaxID=1314678 RepID=A0AAD5HGH9_UMBRA|nr:uncharacterized protein K450DRAFT_278848 [Umbelopsis ramanniana AG]KAI8581776.1 hypothetical protein K450DRAFT_278848 [Umbelopsis ramanniana AG]